MRNISWTYLLLLSFILIGCGGGGGGAAPPATTVTAPGVPASLTAMALSSQALLIWSYPANDGGGTITEYCVYRGTVSGTLTLLGTTGNGSTVYRDHSAVNGTPYFYTVSAMNSSGEGTQTAEVTVTPMGAPSAVQSLAAAGVDEAVNLSWSAPTANGGSALTDYRIYRGTTSGALNLIAATGNTSTNFQDRFVVNGTNYFYSVTAVNSTIESTRCTECAATPMGLPGAPTNVVPVGSDSTIDLTWSAPTNNGGTPIIDYRVYRGTSSGSLALLTSIGSATAAYQDTTVTNGTTYFYAIVAVNGVGDGPQSAEASTFPRTVPAAPQSVEALPFKGQVDLTWTAPANNGGDTITDYRIYRGTTSGSLTYLFNTGSASTLYQDTSVTDFTRYYYAVSAVNSAGEGTLSSEVNALPGVAVGPLVSVSGGTFQMGATDGEGGSADELPRRAVTLSAYRIGKYEVTNEEFADVMTWALAQGYIEGFDIDAGGLVPYSGGYAMLANSLPAIMPLFCALPYPAGETRYCQITFDGTSFGVNTRDGISLAKHPVNEISWFGAVCYCNWLSEIHDLTPCYNLPTSTDRISPLPNGYRLPTEAEWEYAAAWNQGAGSHWIYAMQSDTIEQTRANYLVISPGPIFNWNPLGFTSMPYTTPVGFYNGTGGRTDSPSPVGCYDMSGNVLEWCHDWYASSYYSSGPQTDPTGPATAVERVLRGGDFAGEAPNQRTACRYAINVTTTFFGPTSGFRVARTP